MGRAREYLDSGSVQKFKLHVRPAGTVIFPKRGGAIATNKKRMLGEGAVYDLNTMGLVPSDAVEPQFLLDWLETVDLGTLADGSNVPQINHGDVASLQLPLPSRATQRGIVTEVERRLSLLDSLTVAIDHALIRAKQLRISILKTAFSGQLVPRFSGEDQAAQPVARTSTQNANRTQKLGRHGND
jgi:type I restriction enzyme S subunit